MSCSKLKPRLQNNIVYGLIPVILNRKRVLTLPVLIVHIRSDFLIKFETSNAPTIQIWPQWKEQAQIHGSINDSSGILWQSWASGESGFPGGSSSFNTFFVSFSSGKIPKHRISWIRNWNASSKCLRYIMVYNCTNDDTTLSHSSWPATWLSSMSSRWITVWCQRRP